MSEQIESVEIQELELAEIQELESRVEHAWEIGIGCSTPF